MSEEEKYETKCFCQNKTFRKFLVIALGTFVGVYAALSLFAAIHKPPMHPCPMGYRGPAPIAAPCPFHKHHHHFYKEFKGDKGGFQKATSAQPTSAPFEEKR
jgi:hypothetical protein